MLSGRIDSDSSAARIPNEGQEPMTQAQTAQRLSMMSHSALREVTREFLKESGGVARGLAGGYTRDQRAEYDALKAEWIRRGSQLALFTFP